MPIWNSLHRERRQFLMKQVLIAICTLFAFGMGQARAGAINDSATGLASPAQTITFSEINLPTDTAVTTQYSSLGVSFSPNVYYDPQLGFGFTNDIGNFTFPTQPAVVNPLVMSFSSPESAVAFQMTADSTPFLFQAFLGGTSGSLVASFPGSDVSSTAFYGFLNDDFDTIEITQEGDGGGPYWLISSIQSNPGTSTVPEPSSGILLLTALLAIGFVARNRIAKATPTNN